MRHKQQMAKLMVVTAILDRFCAPLCDVLIALIQLQAAEPVIDRRKRNLHGRLRKWQTYSKTPMAV